MVTSADSRNAGGRSVLLQRPFLVDAASVVSHSMEVGCRWGSEAPTIVVASGDFNVTMLGDCRYDVANRPGLGFGRYSVCQSPTLADFGSIDPIRLIGPHFC